MEKKILKAIEEAYRKGLKDAEGLNDISPYLLTSQVVAQELANKFCQPLVIGRSEQLVCDVCGSNDVIESPHMGRNCNRCNPL